MKKEAIIIIVIIIAGIGIYFLVGSNSKGTQTAPLSTPAEQVQGMPAPGSSVSNTPSTPAPANASVSIKNMSFNPSALSVKTGTTVTWTNNDSVAHTVTADGGLFDSGTLSPGQSFSFTFATAGSISYHCSIHPSMRAAVAVTN